MKNNNVTEMNLNSNGNQERYTSEQKLKACNDMVANTYRRFEQASIKTDDYGNLTEFTDLPSAERFARNMSYVKNTRNIIASGLKGEREAYEAISLMCEDKRILRNIQTPAYNSDYSVEHDMIVITPKGIFSVEVKNIHSHYAEITEQGMLVSKHADNKVRTHDNVVQQSRRHYASIKSVLKGTKYEFTRITSVLLFSNDMCNVENKFNKELSKNYINICYRNNAESVLVSPMDKTVLTTDEINEIADMLEAISEGYEERKYTLCINSQMMDEVVTAYINDVYAQRREEEKKEGIKKHSFLSKISKCFRKNNKEV